MTNIKLSSVEYFLGPICNGLDVKVSLYIVSPKNQGLKKLNLENLSPQERARKLHKWAQEDRFVAVIEMSDKCFAHMHHKHTKLDGLAGLSLNGKKVIVQSLSEENARQLRSIGQAFEKHVLRKEDEEETEKSTHLNFQLNPAYRTSKRVIRELDSPHFFLDQMMKIQVGKIILNVIRQFSESQRQIQKQKESDDKYFDIIRTEIKKEILRSEITAQEIKNQEFSLSRLHAQ